MQNQFFNISSTILLCLLFVPFFLMAQNGTESFHKQFEWQKADESKTIIINVTAGVKMIQMNFEGSIFEGSLQLTAYDPEGNKAAGFSLKASSWSTKEGQAWSTSDGDSWNTQKTEIHVETIGGGKKNSSSNSNSCSTSSSASASGSNVTVTASGGGSSNTATEKAKSKNKNKDSRAYSSTSTSSDSKGAKGIMKKRISDPMPGYWKFVFEVKGVTGTLSANIDQD